MAIKSILDHSRQHIGKIYLTYEYNQPHDDWGGVHKVMAYFQDDPIEIIVHRPTYFLAPNPVDTERARNRRALPAKHHVSICAGKNG